MNIFSNLPEITTITSEVVLSLYPILIKVVDTGLDTQIIARLATFAACSGILGFGTVPITLSGIGLFLFLGLLNLTHITTSYQAFKDLPAGPAMALFYTYPFLNLFLAWLILGEEVKLKYLPWFLFAFIGSILIIRSLKDEAEAEGEEGFEGTSTHKVRGIFSAFAAALTESIIFIVTKNLNDATPFAMMFQLYGGALLLLVLGLFSLGKPIITDFKQSTWIPLIGFNILIGFLGYALRFWSIPRLSTTIFSILSFVGVFSAYAFGVRFVNEVPSIESLAGGAFIATSIAAVQGNFNL